MRNFIKTHARHFDGQFTMKHGLAIDIHVIFNIKYEYFILVPKATLTYPNNFSHFCKKRLYLLFARKIDIMTQYMKWIFGFYKYLSETEWLAGINDASRIF